MAHTERDQSPHTPGLPYDRDGSLEILVQRERDHEETLASCFPPALRAYLLREE
jgi:hypothetical protein